MSIVHRGIDFASSMNFVAAVWYAESIAMPESEAEDTPEIHGRRKAWLQRVRIACPKCFGDEDTSLALRKTWTPQQDRCVEDPTSNPRLPCCRVIF